MVVDIGQRPSRLLFPLGHGRGGRNRLKSVTLIACPWIWSLRDTNSNGVVAIGLPFRVKGGVGMYDSTLFYFYFFNLKPSFLL